jgi:ribose 5-phosphate isomerase A
MDTNQLKKLAAEKAVNEISSGMIVGLGSGSTVQFALEKISERIKNGELKNIWCIPSSMNTEAEANRLGIPIVTFDELYFAGNEKLETEDGKQKSEEGNQKPVLSVSEESTSNIQHPESRIQNPESLCIDVTIDGADEIDQSLNLIKGGGGALLREKVLAQASKKFIVIIDESKISKHLGVNWHLPVEVIQFAVSVESKYLESLGAKVVRRKKTDGSDYITDENNFILDADFGEIKNPEELSALLNQRAGIVEHGLFIGLATKIICATSSGINIIER